MINVVLLKSYSGLGKAGDVVRVKKGYAVNFLMPNGIVLVANKSVMQKINAQTDQINKEDEKMRGEASKLLSSVDGKKLVVIKSSSEDGTLYGAVGVRDVFSEALKLNPIFEKFLTKNSVRMQNSIKTIGKFKVTVNIYDNIEFKTDLIVARNTDEANLIISDQLNQQSNQSEGN